MQFFCQCLLLLSLILKLCGNIYSCAYGVEAREPYGVAGCVGAFIGSALWLATLYGAGAFDSLFR